MSPPKISNRFLGFVVRNWLKNIGQPLAKNLQ
jgi:hypothetical protein